MPRHNVFVFVALSTISALSISQSRSLNLFAQASTPSTTNPPLNIPADVAFLAKLSTNLDLGKCKPGDPVEAQAAQDVKQGSDVLLKKGSALLGRIKTVQMPTTDNPQTVVGIVFDDARLKDGKQFSLHLIIQALAPEANATNNDTLSDGRGMDAATINATVSGHSSTKRGNVNTLTPTSSGVFDLAGLRLGDQPTQAGHVTVFVVSRADIHLKKSTQLVMKVVSQ